MRIKVLVFALAAFAVAGCQQGPTQKEMAEKGKKPLNASQMRSVLSGNTLQGTGDNPNATWTTYFASDGTARGEANWPGGGNQDSGKWKVKENGQFCTRGWSTWDTAGGCHTVYRDGETLIMYQDGKFDQEATVKKGNPMDL
jgi:hypothetical protein